MIDDRLSTELEMLKNDYAAISQKLESKSQAVSILRDALKECEKERDEFKCMAEQVMARYQLLRKVTCSNLSADLNCSKELHQLDHRQLTSLLFESRQANKGLQQQLIEMKAKLGEALGDIKILRKQLSCQTVGGLPELTLKSKIEEKEQLVLQMEALTSQKNELERELARCYDEKQELIIERNIYRNKCDRLNNELNYILNGDDRKILDIDTLIMEKNVLTSRLRTLEEENRLATTTLTKYQRAAEKKVMKSSSVGSECPSPPIEPTNQRAFLTTDQAIQVPTSTDNEVNHFCTEPDQDGTHADG